ncbi:hypothetical protein ZT95_001363 [Salmonella enterica subsp. enterica]|nr:hypothetical protein [Salmonella enterica subsp. enterica]EEA8744115.1 hypothetical protein [Salmonella enterica subsp. enterica serovar Bareilly]EEE9937325.1 hypothetical protein [Salmonella enterica subsp. enterica serovar Oslo]EEF5015738.1 hypothetical protein [Salmonella enterica]HCT0074657.1 hypothetical protein [Salmonella enterica subsp. enterica serovar Stanley]
MNVWVVISGTPYESSEAIEGVYSTEKKAEEKLSTLKNDSLHYAYIEECEVE